MGQHLIFGDDDAKLNAAAKKLRSADASIEIGIRKVSRVNPDLLEESHTVHLLGDFPDIAKAYEGKAQVVTVREDDQDKKPAKKAKPE